MQYVFTNLDAFLAEYDRLGMVRPIYLTETTGRIPPWKDHPQEEGYYLVVSFRHDRNAYVCYRRLETVDEQLDTRYGWMRRIQKDGRLLERGMVTGAWPLRQELLAVPEPAPA
jgi:hypothetical protein